VGFRLNFWGRKAHKDSTEAWAESAAAFFDEGVEVPSVRTRRELIMVGEALEEMCATDGWKLVEERIASQMGTLFKTLLTCPVEEAAVVRERIKVMVSLRDYIRSCIVRGRDLKREIARAELEETEEVI
jgi:hypothetical protein